MASVKVLTPDGKTSGKADLPEDVFDVPVNVPLIHQVVVAQQAAARRGTASAKTRGEVRGGGAKPYRQKGTGRARQGSTRAPQFAGGGVVHGPVPRNYAQRTPKKMKAAALRGALSDRARGDRIHVLSSLVDGEVPSTSAVVALLQTITEARHVLVVVDRDDALAWKSLRNVSSVHAIAPDQLNTYDVLVSDEVIFTSSALEAFLASHPRVAKSDTGQPAAVIEAAEAVTETAAKPAKTTATKAAKPAKTTATKATKATATKAAKAAKAAKATKATKAAKAAKPARTNAAKATKPKAAKQAKTTTTKAAKAPKTTATKAAKATKATKASAKDEGGDK